VLRALKIEALDTSAVRAPCRTGTASIAEVPSFPHLLPFGRIVGQLPRGRLGVDRHIHQQRGDNRDGDADAAATRNQSTTLVSAPQRMIRATARMPLSGMRTGMMRPNVRSMPCSAGTNCSYGSRGHDRLNAAPRSEFGASDPSNQQQREQLDRSLHIFPPAEIVRFNSLNDSPKRRRPSDNPGEMSDVRLEPLGGTSPMQPVPSRVRS
jgi:hypothetical protein